MNRAPRLLIAALALVLAGACDSSIVKGWLIDRPRVLGARVEAESDPARASLAPSERARISWLVASPGPGPQLAWAFAACVPPVGNFAAPHCAGPALGAGSGTSAGEVATMPLIVPTEGATGSSQELLVLAAFCLSGRPALDAAAFAATCDDGAEPLLASLNVRLAAAGPNTNPRPLSGVRFGDKPLPEDDHTAANATCDTAPNAPPATAGASIDFVYTLDALDREPGEALIASSTITAGKLDHQYFALDADEAAPKELRNTWKPPADDVPTAGRIVAFYLGLRDGRGGASFARFVVCVRP